MKQSHQVFLEPFPLVAADVLNATMLCIDSDVSDGMCQVTSLALSVTPYMSPRHMSQATTDHYESPPSIYPSHEPTRSTTRKVAPPHILPQLAQPAQQILLDPVLVPLQKFPYPPLSTSPSTHSISCRQTIIPNPGPLHSAARYRVS
jgi:hypothetical protein